MQEDLSNISTTIKKLHSIVQDNLNVFTNMVDEIIDSNCKDEKNIELTLDKLLDFCFDKDVLILYKRLCRFFYKINPNATQDYVNYYRDMYENEDN